MCIDFILSGIKNNRLKDAVVYKDEVYNYGFLNERIEYWKTVLDDNIPSGKVVALLSDYSPDGISLLLALIDHKCIIVPVSDAINTQREKYLKISQAEYYINPDEFNENGIMQSGQTAANKLYDELRSKGHAGLVLFSSGSTGEIKGIVHDLNNLLQKYKTKGKDLRTITFLLFDHIGGIDTLFYLLANTSSIITLSDRSPDNVCCMIEKYKAEVLPVSPTFLNLLFLSEAYYKYDLSSLKIITYGTEPMPGFLLKKGNEIFPGVKFIQKFGTTETGTLRTKSKSSDSLWLKLGDDQTGVRVIDGILQIKAGASMIGYLNAPNPFTEDGWFVTGDLVETEGEYYKILGRNNDIINVGGQKVYPAEIESVIMEIENIKDVIVSAKENPVMGQVVGAEVALIKEENKNDIKKRVQSYCRQKLEAYKVPLYVDVVGSIQYSERFKRIRK